MHPGLHPYPTEFPQSAFPVLIAALRRQEVDPKEVAHIAWHAAGFGLSKWDTHVIAGSGQPLTEEEAADLLEKQAAAHGAEAAVDVPWDLLVPVLLALLKRLLNR